MQRAAGFHRQNAEQAPCLSPLSRHRKQRHRRMLLAGQVPSSALTSTGSLTRQSLPPGTPELSASTARRTGEQLRGPLAACHPCPRASTAPWAEAPWVTRASCPRFLQAPGSRAAVQWPQIPLRSVFSRLINPIIVTVVTRWHSVQLYHAFCLIDVQLASQRWLLVTTLFDGVALKLHVPLVPMPDGWPAAGSSCLGPGEPVVGRPSAEHKWASSLRGAGLPGKTGRRGPFNILKLGRGTRPPAIPSRLLPAGAGQCCPQGSAVLSLRP